MHQTGFSSAADVSQSKSTELCEIFEKVSFKSEQMKNFRRYKYAYIYRLNTKIRLAIYV